MQTIRKIPAFSLVLLVSGYTFLGWLLAIHGASWQVWLTTGAIACGIDWILAVGWALAAIYYVFARAEAFILSVGGSLIWALLMYAARIEVQAVSGAKWQSFLILGAIAAGSMAIGWFADANLIPSLGNAIIKP